MQKAKKIRLDHYLLDLFPQYSRQQLQSWIMQGLVLCDGQKVTKPGTLVKPDCEPETLFCEPKFVSRAGLKLEKALLYWDISVAQKVCLDAGISTGGFTDCLLQHGAARVHGIDVGAGLVHWKIRQDPRLVLHEKTNLRYIESVGEPIEVVTLDVSFISLLKVMDAVKRILVPQGTLITLIKPQFEAGRAQVEAGGLITDDVVHQEVVQKVTIGIQEYGFELIGVTESPILGGSGNKEFLAYFKNK